MSGQRDPERPLAGVRSRVSDTLGDMWWAFMVRGVLAAALGLCALVWPSASLAILIRLVGVFCLADGVTGLIGALRTADRGAHLLQALLGLVVGVVLLFWPEGSVRTLLVIFGMWALLTGVSQIWAARQQEVGGGERGPMSTLGWVAAVVGLILIVWPGTGVVTIAWLIAIAALLIAVLLIWLALRFKRLKERVATFGAGRRWN
jgi:uncharacterized membrane protein HdeD (DUF308 family)